METTTISIEEGARSELLGAQRRLQCAEAELEFFFAQHGERDDKERHLLEVERDEARRLVEHCRQLLLERWS